MTTAPHSAPRHAVSRAVASVQAQLEQVADSSMWSMPAAETAATLTALTRLTASVAELEARVAAHAETVEVAAASGATSTANWWAVSTRMTRSEAHAKTRLAAGLQRYPGVRTALAAGHLLPDQAHVIVRALEELPPDLDHDLVAQAEAHLVAEAAHYDAKALRILGRRLLEVVAPEIAEAHEAKLLEQEEARAAAAARFTMVEDGHGSARGRFTLPAAQAAMLRKALLALAAPKHRAATGHVKGEPVATPERMGRAFMEYVEGYPAADLPQTGGTDATIVITMSLDSLTGGPAPAQLDTGEVISAAQARRLACEAGLIPAVLDGASQVLDLGRKRRFHTRAQRIAIALRDGGCTAQGCDWPPGLCHTHHDPPWAQGGGTSVTGGRLLCPRHHTHAHDPTYSITKLPNGKIAFTRRT